MIGLYDEPWAITEGGLQLIVAIASRDQFFADVRERALAAREGKPLQNTRAVEMRGDVAIIPAVGPMFRHADMINEVSGATSYATLRKDFQKALDDQSVRAILMNFDSVGGEANGVSELANAIYQARGKKPIVAYVGGVGASAAYWLASACDEIVISDTAVLGSIGTMAVYRDSTKKQEAAGEREIRIISSQSPYKNADPATDEGLARVQKRLDAMSEVFIGAVARNRGVTAKTVLSDFGQGDVMVGQAAVDSGLADRIGNFEQVLADMASRQKGAFTMSMKATLGLPEEATAEQVEQAMTAKVQAHAELLSVIGASTDAEARAKALAGVEALRDIGGVRTELATVRAAAIRGGLRTVLEAGLDRKQLSLGRIQKSLAVVLRGEQKAAWAKAMDGLETVNRETVLNAACSIAISQDDLDAIGEYAKSAAATVAAPELEPKRRDGSADAKALTDVDREMAESLGMDEETLTKFSGVRSADDLKARAKATPVKEEA